MRKTTTIVCLSTLLIVSTNILPTHSYAEEKVTEEGIEDAYEEAVSEEVEKTEEESIAASEEEQEQEQEQNTDAKVETTEHQPRVTSLIFPTSSFDHSF
ncbi:hypothetical protein JCM19045_4954 [Bacillus sp. JCM 19045]|nr:hypothetical protein JCM19045_4954 [Bacillus sp. JCM 19045]